MSLREKTISGAKWSAMATIVIIGLGLVQMTVLARIIDNHQFGLLTVSLVIIALADTLSDFGIANSIIQRKEISHLELTTLYWLNVGLGIFVFVLVFLWDFLAPRLQLRRELRAVRLRARRERTPATRADPAAELIQLRQTHIITIVDDQSIGIFNIQSGLDNRSCHQDIIFLF